METSLKKHIEYLLCVNIERISPVSGGDISQAFLLETESERFFCKVNHNHNSYEMFLAEKEGLEAIARTKTIATPNILLCEKLEKGGLLLMEYVESKTASPSDNEKLGHHLAALHHVSNSSDFGWEKDNFIGNLQQSNNHHSKWAEFYVQERLLPQLKRAQDSKLIRSNEVPSETRLLKTCKNLFPEVSPSLLHGDLWGGNYLISKEGTPYLIDPAVYFGHHEVDIAMSQLFGGFGDPFLSGLFGAFSLSAPRAGT